MTRLSHCQRNYDKFHYDHVKHVLTLYGLFLGETLKIEGFSSNLDKFTTQKYDDFNNTPEVKEAWGATSKSIK